MAPKPIRKEAGTISIPSIVVKAANPLQIKSVNGVFALTFTAVRHHSVPNDCPPTLFDINQLHLVPPCYGSTKETGKVATGSRCAMLPERPSGAAFGCTRSKYLLGLPETSRNRPGSKLITTRRFTQMAGRNSWCYRTLGRGLEQCFPTSKYATCTPSLPWAKSCTLPKLPSD